MPISRFKKDLLATYPNEMTIVLQHQYWDLEIGEDYFSVVLSFNNLRQPLVIPFDAVVAFADPSVRFGLQFEYEDGQGAEEAQSETPDGGKTVPNAENDGGDENAQKEAKIITLDSFRKK